MALCISVSSSAMQPTATAFRAHSPNNAKMQTDTLPPIGSLASISISPLHSERRIHSTLPSLHRTLPRSCCLLGCANFAKIHGYCADHYHSHENTNNFSSAPTLPPLRFESSTIADTNYRFHRYTPTSATTNFSNHQHQHYLPPLTIPATSPARRFSDPTLHNAFHLPRPAARSVPVYSPPRTLPARRASVDSTNASTLSPTNSVRSTNSSKPTQLCRRANCTNEARRKGLCMEHGGRHFCKMDGCSKCAHRGGYCIAHGGGRRCAVANCTKSAQSGGVCYSHGGGKRCSTNGCTHAARSGGFCIKHGKMLKQQEANADNDDE